ncbi:MAG: sulfotransferase family 2 domain-containing protein [Crocosphaera sp.]|nr:sulfotransferase family 2 domain-containing protein [Crocosphaera sp.]
MAIICPEKKLLFIMAPGTGSSSLGKVLIKNLNGEFIPSDNMYDGKKVINFKHTTIQEIIRYNIMSRAELAIHLKFTTIRNPFDLLASEYQRYISDWIIKATKFRIEKKKEKFLTIDAAKRNQEKVRNQGFDAWLKERLEIANNKHSFIRRVKSKVKYSISPYLRSRIYPFINGTDKIIRFENLEEDFNNLLKEAEIIKRNQWIDVPNVNPTAGKKPYQEYYTITSRKMVEKCLAQELRIFNYKFN